MRTIYAIGLIVTIAGRLPAQTPDRATRPTRSPETLERFEKQIFHALFTGIRLSAAQDSAGHAAIRESLVKREMIQATGESYMQEARAIVQARDGRLRELLQTEPDRATFDANAKLPIYMVDGVIWISLQRNRSRTMTEPAR